MRWLITLCFCAAASVSTAADSAELLKSIKAVTREGAGNQQAQAAWKALVGQGGDALLPTLAAMDDATPLANNWLRSAVTAIAEKEKAAGKARSAKPLETFVTDSTHGPVGRRLAYELLTEIDPKASARLLPGFLNDPSGDMRRDAIAAELPKAEAAAKADPKAAKALYEKLFQASRDQDQAETIAKAIKELGGKADLTGHFGVVTKWLVVGPFDSTKGAGFDKAYPPEAGVDPKATYKGKDGDIAWKPWASDDTYGKVDLNKALPKYTDKADPEKGVEKYKDSAAYAFTVIESDADRPVELRFGSYCALKVFLNGKLMYAREEYHHGERFDQYLARGTLKKGKNELLVKVCQNNQTEAWALNWQFMLRICDATGGAVPMTVTGGK